MKQIQVIDCPPARTPKEFAQSRGMEATATVQTLKIPYQGFKIREE